MNYGGYTQQDYQQYQIGNGLLPQNYYQDDKRLNEQFAGSYMYNQASTPTGADTASAADYRYGASSRKYDNYMDGKFSQSAHLMNRTSKPYTTQNSSFLSRQGEPQMAASFEPFEPQTSKPYSYSKMVDKRQVRSSNNRNAVDASLHQEPRMSNSFNAFDSPTKKRVKSDIDHYEPDQRSVLSGSLAQPVRQMHSPKFGQRSSRSNNDVIYQKADTS